MKCCSERMTYCCTWRLQGIAVKKIEIINVPINYINDSDNV